MRCLLGEKGLRDLGAVHDLDVAGLQPVQARAEHGFFLPAGEKIEQVGHVLHFDLQAVVVDGVGVARDHAPLLLVEQFHERVFLFQRRLVLGLGLVERLAGDVGGFAR